MEEKVIKSGRIKVLGKPTMILLTLAIFVSAYVSFMMGCNWIFYMYVKAGRLGQIPDGLREFCLCLGVVLAIVGIIVPIWHLYFCKMQIILTDKRVYGKTAFGKQVDLPLDSISAVGTSWFKGIAVGTSSGRIVFHGISNRDEIYEEVKKLLANRQADNFEVKTIAWQTQSSAEELKKFKELLDNGIITQEEFDAKKKQLLGL